jgi:HAD superfamily hydrolase (TIGR01509 family)
MPEGILFDMDGVLVDTEELIARASVEMFREKGLLVTQKDFLPFVGTGEIRYLGGVAEKYGFPLDITEAKKRVYEIYEEIAKGSLTLLPGVKTFIGHCRERGLKMAVATSADRVKMLINLEEGGLPQEWFDALVTAEDVVHKKPAPDIYLKAAEKLGVSPQRCLVIEDAPAGVTAGKQAGARVLALTTSFPAEKLQEADWVAPDLSRVPKEALAW